MTTTPPYDDSLFQGCPRDGQIHVVPDRPVRYRVPGEDGGVHIYERVPLGDRKTEAFQRGYSALYRFVRTEQLPTVLTVGELRTVVREAAHWPADTPVHIDGKPVQRGGLTIGEVT